MSNCKKGNRKTPAESIWAGAFGWDGLLSWSALGVLVPGVLFAGGIFAVSLDWIWQNLLVGQIMFTVAAILLIAGIFRSSRKSNDSVAARTAFAVSTSAVVILIWLALFANIQARKHSPALQDPRASQLRPAAIAFSPPRVGQRYSVDVHYDNIGPDSVNLKINQRVFVVGAAETPGAVVGPGELTRGKSGFRGVADAVGGTGGAWADTSADSGEAKIRTPILASSREILQNKVWEMFESETGSDNKDFSYITPPFRDSWTTVSGPVATSYEYRRLTDNSQMVLVFLLMKFRWKSKDSDKWYGYQICEFIAGNPKVVFDCQSHNGPYVP